MPEARRADGDSLTSYLTFARAHRALFTNPPGDIFAIILDDAEIRRVESEAARRLAGSGHPAEWARVGIVYEDEYMLILRDAVRFPDGDVGTYVRIVGRWEAAGVAILPVHEGRVLLVRHFRHATRRWHLEIPRGFGAPSVSVEENAERELLAEVGAMASRLIALGEMHVDTGMFSGRVHLFYASATAPGAPETHESIAEVVPIALPELERMIRDGEITDSFTIAAHSRAALRALL